jgi:hypothetical protein
MLDETVAVNGILLSVLNMMYHNEMNYTQKNESDLIGMN